MAKTKTKGKVLLHHPKIRKEIRRSRKLANLLIEKSGWVEGSLPPEDAAPAAPSGQGEPPADESEKAPAKKAAAANKSEGK